jgi:ParB family transcriptional regulator, chromosome partitioning protein
MNPITTHSIADTPKASLEAEWHCLDMSYQHLRQRTPQAQRRLMLSIHTHGLMVPITVIPVPSPIPNVIPRWVVIDGYLRISAMRSLGKDTIAVQTCELPADEALLLAYKAHQSRPWEPLEEARLLQEMATNYGYSQAQLAQKLGKSESWVHYRLQLLAELPSHVMTAIDQGTLSLWSASRVLIPFARANAHHAELFINYLHKHPHSSREIKAFYEQYMQSRPKVREQMISQPALFFKAKTAAMAPSLSKKLSPDFPEQIWEQRLARIVHELHNTLEPLLPKLFHARQILSERQYLEHYLHQAMAAMERLHQSLRRIPYVQTTDDTNRQTVT